jgi:hypothetical protein
MKAVSCPLSRRDPLPVHGISHGIGFTTTRMLTQTLSNLVTGNQELLDRFWSVHMEIPEEQSVLM